MKATHEVSTHYNNTLRAVLAGARTTPEICRAANLTLDQVRACLMRAAQRGLVKATKRGKIPWLQYSLTPDGVAYIAPPNAAESTAAARDLAAALGYHPPGCVPRGRIWTTSQKE